MPTVNLTDFLGSRVANSKLFSGLLDVHLLAPDESYEFGTVRLVKLHVAAESDILLLIVLNERTSVRLDRIGTKNRHLHALGI